MNELETDPYDEFIDSLPSSLRLKVVQSLEGDDAPTEVQPEPPETPPSAPRTALEPWERVLLVLAVLPVLVLLGGLVMMGMAAAHVGDWLVNYIQEKIEDAN